MLEVDRGDFTPKLHYLTTLISIGYNVTISDPQIHAFVLENFAEYSSEDKKILDIGSGTGYMTVTLSKMINDTEVVLDVEHIKNYMI